jgi:hypothetical protein
MAFFCCFASLGQRARDTIFSAKLDADRTFSVSLPLSYDKTKDKKYPLLLLLDGEYLFDVFNGNFAYGNYWDDLPEVIIVGLDQNQNNQRELDCLMNQEGLPDETGAAFFEFIGAELIPALEKQYRLSPFRIIAGHNLTAGFMNLFLYKEDPIFSGYISMGAEFGEQMMERIPVMLKTAKKPIFYYHSAADGDLQHNLKGIQTLDGNIKTILNSNINYRYDEFKGASHYSLVAYSVPNAIYHIFSSYQPISKTEFDEKLVKLESGYVDYLIKKYETINKAYGAKMAIRITDFKAVEAAILKNKAYAEFEKLAALSRKAYPKSMLSAFHMGMFYEKSGDYKKAMKSYQSGFLLDPIGDLTKDFMIEKVEEMKQGSSAKKAEEALPEPTPTETQDPIKQEQPATEKP